MQFFIVQAFSLILMMSAVSAYVPAAHAQSPSNSCNTALNGIDCPPGQRCVAAGYDTGDLLNGVCMGSVSPSSSGSSWGAPNPVSGPGGVTVQQTGTRATGENIMLMNPLKGSGKLEDFLTRILDFVIRIGAIVVTIMVIYVGFQFVTAQGEPKKIADARNALLWTVIGALILLGAKAIAIGIEATVQAISVGR